MIPKIIHYCWFGGKPLSDDTKKYILTWKKYCSDYEIIEWNENNFDIYQNQYCKEAYKAKKWAFVSDYARLKILYDYGGIYLDTDVEVCKSFNDLLNLDFFACYENTNISLGTFGASKKNNYIKLLLNDYNDRHFINENGEYDYTTNLLRITQITSENFNLKKMNTYDLIDNNHVIFPNDYFIAKDIFSGKILKTRNTYAIHHYEGSWQSKEQKAKMRIRRILTNVFGENIVLSLIQIKNIILKR